MKKYMVFLSLLLLTNTLVFAQSEEMKIKEAVNYLFTGMKTGDSTIARKAFSSGCIMQTINIKNGKTLVKTESVDAFLKMITTPHTSVYDERIVFTKILIDGPLAMVWTDYKFYLSEKFSHCGVNSFQLVKGDQGWQIVYLIDTRRKEGCG